MTIIFIGMETSGAFRRRFQSMGFETYSCDTLPSEDGGEEMAYSAQGLPLGRHMIGDVYQTLENFWANDMWPDLAIFHITCTYLTGSAEWAFKDPDFERYPGVGYHQRLKPGTLYGAARREAREKSKDEFRRVIHLPIRRKVVENPVGALSQIRKPSQIIQPFQFGDDASKKTCLWFIGKKRRGTARHGPSDRSRPTCAGSMGRRSRTLVQPNRPRPKQVGGSSRAMERPLPHFPRNSRYGRRILGGRST